MNKKLSMTPMYLLKMYEKAEPPPLTMVSMSCANLKSMVEIVNNEIDDTLAIAA